MSNWKEYRFSDFVNINPSVKLQPGHTYSFVEMKDLEPSNKFCQPNALRKLSGGMRFEENDTLFARITPCLEKGKICQVRNLKNKQGFGSTEFHVLRGKPNISSNEFVYYLSRWTDVRDFAEINLHGTSGRQRMPKEAFNELLLELPPLPEQEAIAEVLSSLDDKIDLLHRNNQTLEALAETLFRQWFIEEADDSWEERSLCDFLEIKGGFTYKGEYIGNGDALLLGMGCVSSNNRFLLSGARPYSGHCPEKYMVKPGDLVIATRQQSDNLPILGFPAIVPDDFLGKKVIVGANLYRVSNNSLFSNYLLYLLLKTREYKDHIIASAKGSTVRMITKDAIESYRFVLPPKEVIDSLEQVITPINHKSIAITKQIHTLTTLRENLLPKLLSGKVKVNNPVMA